ncbi:MAG: ABC transporter ATP-binding protein [Desulfovibrionaceae bacterium]|nr:ABC transporter ATP-binding protein [Desulfovibrionaceae bacterium]
MPTPLLSLRDVARHFSVRRGVLDGTDRVLRAVDGVDLDVARGETVGLVGESGCGKSTLARMAVRLMKPSAGRVLYAGADIWNGTPADMDGTARDGGTAGTRPGPVRNAAHDWTREYPRRVQMIFQDPFSSLNPRRSVGAAIGESLAALSIGSRAWRRGRVAELLERVGLAPDHSARYPHEFSGGQRQRIAIARALAPEPELVVCDEPVSALDVSIQAQVLNLLRELQETMGLTYLFISHDLSVVSHVSDRVAVMYLGRLVELAPGDALLAAPEHPYAQALVQAAPVPDPARRAARAALLTGDVPSPIDPPSGCAFHTRCPHAMDICSRQDPAWTATAPGRSVRCFLYSAA